MFRVFGALCSVKPSFRNDLTFYICAQCILYRDAQWKLFLVVHTYTMQLLYLAILVHSCIVLFSHLLLIHTRSISSEIINSYYHIRRYTDKVSQTRQCNQASCSSLLSATGQWALGQPRKESQFPAFGNLHKSPSWRQASGQTVEFDEEESMVG